MKKENQGMRARSGSAIFGLGIISILTACQNDVDRRFKQIDPLNQSFEISNYVSDFIPNSDLELRPGDIFECGAQVNLEEGQIESVKLSILNQANDASEILESIIFSPAISNPHLEFQVVASHIGFELRCLIELQLNTSEVVGLPSPSSATVVPNSNLEGVFVSAPLLDQKKVKPGSALRCATRLDIDHYRVSEVYLNFLEYDRKGNLLGLLQSERVTDNLIMDPAGTFQSTYITERTNAGSLIACEAEVTFVGDEDVSALSTKSLVDDPRTNCKLYASNRDTSYTSSAIDQYPGICRCHSIGRLRQDRAPSATFIPDVAEAVCFIPVPDIP